MGEEIDNSLVVVSLLAGSRWLCADLDGIDISSRLDSSCSQFLCLVEVLDTVAVSFDRCEQWNGIHIRDLLRLVLGAFESAARRHLEF